MHNIVNKKAMHLKKVFFESESEYVNELMKKQGMFTFVRECSETKDTHILFAAAQKLVDKIELGLVKEDELEKVESQIIVLLAAIKDKVIEKDFTIVSEKKLKKTK